MAEETSRYVDHDLSSRYKVYLLLAYRKSSNVELHSALPSALASSVGIADWAITVQIFTAYPLIAIVLLVLGLDSMRAIRYD